MGTDAVVIAILITHWKNELGLIDKTPAAYSLGYHQKGQVRKYEPSEDHLLTTEQEVITPL